MAIKIVTDTSSNISIEEAIKLNIEMLPIGINFGDESYDDIYELSMDDFYKKLVSSKSFPKTTQVSPSKMLDIFEKAKDNGDEIITLLISSKLSGTHNTACVLANQLEYDKIYTVDTLNTVVSLRILVMEACRLRDDGKSAKEIVDHINNISRRIRLLAVVDTLEYLCKGGRLSKTAMILGEFLKIKPIIAIENGEVTVKAKCRGTIKASVKMKDLINESPIDKDYPVYFIYTMTPNKMDRLISTIALSLGIKEYQTSNISGAVGSHIGPDAAGIVYIEKE